MEKLVSLLIRRSDVVADILEKEGYKVDVFPGNLHNAVIVSIKKGGLELTPFGDFRHLIGLGNPREHLPDDIVEFLDEYFYG